MEISKLTICRQDVIVVSDSESESNEGKRNKKKKLKKKTTCIRNVKLTTMTVNRIVPNCNRQKCRNGQHYHRQTSKNTKYERVPSEMTCKKREASSQTLICETPKSDADRDMALTTDLYSPITVASSSDTFENISSSSFVSSDSDELEDLINITRKRMKNDNFNICPLRKPVCATITQDDYQNISSGDDVFDSSIHSMDTVVLYNGDNIAPHPRSPEHLSEIDIEQNNNNNLDPMLLCKNSDLDKELLQNKITSLASENNNNNLSPLYEISGKVFMEHYLNTSFI